MKKVLIYLRYNFISIFVSFLGSFLIIVPIVNKNVDYYFLFIIGGVAIIVFLFFFVEALIIYCEIKKNKTLEYQGEVIKARLMMLRMGNFGHIYGVKMSLKDGNNSFIVYYFLDKPKRIVTGKAFNCPKHVELTYYKHSFVIKECANLNKLIK